MSGTAFNPYQSYGMNALGGGYVIPKNVKQPTTGTGAQGLVTQDDVYGANAPQGYEWEPIQTQYVRTPEYVADRENRYTTSRTNSALSNLGSTTNRLSSALGGLTGGGSGGGIGSGFDGGGFSFGGSVPSALNTGMNTNATAQGASRAPDIQMPDFDEANANAFARAKDRSGGLARSNITSLNDALAAMGMLGSGAHVEGTRKAIADSMGELGDVNREQAIQGSERASEFVRTKYQGDIAQRGQDINDRLTQRGQNVQLQEAQARLAFEQSQAAYQRNLQMLQMIMGGFGGGVGSGFDGTRY